MKRIILSTLLAFIITSSYAQDLTEAQSQGLEDKARELYPTNATQRKNWKDRQTKALESLSYASYDIDDEKLDAIKQEASKKFPNDYIAQEDYIYVRVNNENELKYLSQGIDPEEFEQIKAIATKESNDDPSEYIALVSAQVESKNRIQYMNIPTGIDPVDFKLLQRITEKYYPYNYKKQEEEVQAKLEFLLSISAAKNSADKNNPNAYNTVGLAMLKAHTLQTGDSEIYVAVAVRFKDKAGFFCPISAYKKGFEILTPLGDKVEIEAIHLSKTEPVFFAEVKRFPVGIDAIEIAKLDDVKTMLSKNLSLAGYTSATKSSVIKNSVTAIKDDAYVLTNKIPANFSEGSVLLDYEDQKLISFSLREGATKREIPDFSDKSQALSSLRRPTYVSKANIVSYYPVIEKLEQFELLDDKKMQSQIDFLNELKADNEEALKLYTSTSLSQLISSKKYGRVAKDGSAVFKGRLGEDKFQKEAKSLMFKLISQLKAGHKADINPNILYVNVRAEVMYQLELRNKLIEYYQNAINDDLESIIPRDIMGARSEPVNTTGSSKGKKGSSSNRSNSNSLISSPL